jgi:hypothetical protein
MKLKISSRWWVASLVGGGSLRLWGFEQLKTGGLY